MQSDTAQFDLENEENIAPRAEVCLELKNVFLEVSYMLGSSKI